MLYLNEKLESKFNKFDLQIALLKVLFNFDKQKNALYKFDILNKEIIKNNEFKEYINIIL